MKPLTNDDIALSLGRILRDMTPRLWALPLLAVALIAATVAQNVVGMEGGWLARGGNWGPALADGQVWRLLTHAFLHLDPAHLASNLLGFVVAGYFVERLTGGPGLLLAFAISSIGGGLASMYWHPWTVSVGSSGAVYGLFGCVFGFYAVQRRRFPSSVLSFIVAVCGAFLFWAVFTSFRSGVDFAAHAGGFAAGVAAGALLVVPLDRRARALRWRRCGIAASVALIVFAPFVLYAQTLNLRPHVALAALAEAEETALEGIRAAAATNDAAATDAALQNAVTVLSALELPTPYDRMDYRIGQAFQRIDRARALRANAYSLVAMGVDGGTSESFALAVGKHREIDESLEFIATTMDRLEGRRFGPGPVVKVGPELETLFPKARAARLPSPEKSYSDTVISDAMSKATLSIFSCYHDALEKNPSLGGDVTVAFTVNPPGDVANVRVEGLDVIEACIAEIVGALEFAPTQLANPADYEQRFHFGE